MPLERLPDRAAGPGRNLRAETGHHTRHHRRTDRAVDDRDRYAYAYADPDHFDGTTRVDGSDDTVINDDDGPSGRAAGGTLTALGNAADPGETSRNSNACDSHGRHHLQATDGPTNQQKGDGDAATWLPPNKSYRCTYVARQIAVKSSYRLWVTPAEKDAITRVLTTCTNTPAPPAPSTPDTAAPTSSTASSSTVPPPAAAIAAADPTTLEPTLPDRTTTDPTTADPTTPAADAGTGSSSYYPNCTAAKAAGVAPLYRGQPGYRPGLDRDSDGIACEK